MGFQSILSVRRVGRQGSRRMSSKPRWDILHFSGRLSHKISVRLDTAAAIVAFQRCLEPGCYRNPHYGVSRLIDPTSKAQYCTKHKAPGELFTGFLCCVVQENLPNKCIGAPLGISVRPTAHNSIDIGHRPSQVWQRNRSGSQQCSICCLITLEKDTFAEHLL